MFKMTRNKMAANARQAFQHRHDIASADDPVEALETRLFCNAMSRLKIDDPANQEKLRSLFQPRSIPTPRFVAALGTLHTLTTDENARVFETVKLLKGISDAG